MSRKALLELQSKGRRLRFMKNSTAVKHWTNVLAATPQQIDSLENPADDRVCLLVGPPVEHWPGDDHMFPIEGLAWMQPDLVLPGELVGFSWLEFYQGKQDSRKGSKASTSTWRRRRRCKGKRSIASSSHEACEPTPIVPHALHEDEAYKTFER